MQRSDSTCKYLQPLHQKEVSGQPYTPVASEPLKNKRYPVDKKWVGLWGRLGNGVEKIR